MQNFGRRKPAFTQLGELFPGHATAQCAEPHGLDCVTELLQACVIARDSITRPVLWELGRGQPPLATRPPHKDAFGAQYTARLSLCERFALPVARHNASLEAKATG